MHRGAYSEQQVAVDRGGRLGAYDVREDQPYDHRSFFVSVRGQDADEITTWWKGLSDGAGVLEDLGPAGWSRCTAGCGTASA
ncbi:hypothetical protein [Actinoplanes sp. N902-109]|uniref:hypothetical protein n=1 Tax=Actinoplanes sp. (strain N902-109) TaxID=649831 RepID=UPI00039DD60B|nr:hypothetical protein [Actinoplanes sp. N902-109]